MESRDESQLSAGGDYVFQFVAGCEGPEGSQVYFAARSSGLFCSHDRGRTWAPAYGSLHAQSSLPTTSVVLAPNFEHERAVFAGLNEAILCSYDGGAVWHHARLPSPLPAITSLAISPDYAADGTLFAGTNEDGVLISQDRGRSWAAWNFGLLDLNILCLALSPDFAADETVFAGTESGLFRSTNGGRAWREVVLPIPFDAVLSLAVSPSFARDGIVFAGSENYGLLMSQDCGRSWQEAAQVTASAPINQILLYPGASIRELLILLGGTLYSSRDRGKTWQPWKSKRLAGCNITAALRLDIPTPNTLIGTEGGRIVLV